MFKSYLVTLKLACSTLFHPPEKHFLALDGVRAMAIFFVVALHCQVTVAYLGLNPSKISTMFPFQGGWVGVPLFFVLSGFFIGSQLWRELEKTNQINIVKFILRRGLRIWPLYYLVLLIAALFFSHKYGNIWTNLFFLANYFGDDGPISGAWSLATEEQFYILIPIVIFLLAKHFSLRQISQYRYLLIFCLILPILTRFSTWFYLTGFKFYDVNILMHYIYRPFHTHFDELIMGLIISNVLSDKKFIKPKWLSYPILLMIVAATVASLLIYSQKVIFTYTGLALIFGSFVWMNLTTENIITKMLSWRPFYWIAKISFGIYLIHFSVIWTLESCGWYKLLKDFPTVHLLSTLFIVFSISCAVSSLTYVLVEAPFLAWRNKLLN